MKIKIPIPGTVGRSVAFDPNSGARAEAAVAALAAQINAGLGASIRHSSLQGLQIGDDHPQYTGNQFPETITGQWNFQTIPFIQGATLAEYIEDVVGGSFFDFLQDTSSVVWTYFDTAQELEANVPPEFVQDTVGAMLVDTSTVDFTYDDTLGQISAVVPGAALSKTDDTNVTLTLGGTPLTALARAASLTLGWTGTLAVPRGGSGAATLTGYLKGNGAAAFTASATIPYSDISGTPTIPTGANPSASVGLAAVNGSAATFLRSDGAPALSQAISPAWTGNHTFSPASGNTVVHVGNLLLDADNLELQLGASQDLRLYHDGTNSYLRNATGELRLLATSIVGGAPLAGAVKFDVQNTDAGTGSYVQTRYLNNAGRRLAFFMTSSTWAGGAIITGGATGEQAAIDTDTVDLAINGATVSLAAGGTVRAIVAAARVSFSVPARLPGYTVATLPTGTVRDTAYVTDALAPTFGATVAGGGAIGVPVFFDGSNWKVG